MRKLLLALLLLFGQCRLSYAAIACPNTTGLLTASNVTSTSTNLGWSPTVGNHLFVALSGYQAGQFVLSSVSDNQAGGGNTYTIDAQQANGTTAIVAASITSAKVTASSGTFTVTLTSDGAGSYMSYSITECSGVAATSWLDKTGTNSASAAPGANTATVTASGANSQANELVVAVMGPYTFSTNLHIGTPTASYTETFVNQNGAAIVAGEGA
jgi:hypothetical protein